MLPMFHRCMSAIFSVPIRKIVFFCFPQHRINIQCTVRLYLVENGQLLLYWYESSHTHIHQIKYTNMVFILHSSLIHIIYIGIVFTYNKFKTICSRRSISHLVYHTLCVDHIFFSPHQNYIVSQVYLDPLHIICLH